MVDRAVAARDVPAAPPILDRRRMVDSELTCTPHKHSRNAGGRVRIVTTEAIVAPDERRLPDDRLIEHIEGGAILRIVSGEFDKTTADPSDGNFIVEKQRA